VTVYCCFPVVSHLERIKILQGRKCSAREPEIDNVGRQLEGKGSRKKELCSAEREVCAQVRGGMQTDRGLERELAKSDGEGARVGVLVSVPLSK